QGRADIEKAHHWYSAHNTTRALIGSWQASMQASNAVAHAERLMLLDRVLEVWGQVPDAEERIGADHVRVLEEAVASAKAAGDHQRGLASAELALAELDEVAQPVRVALLLCERFGLQKELGRHRSEDDLHRGLALVPETVSKSARMKLLLAFGHCRHHDAGPQYRTIAADALRLARELGDREAESQALVNLAMLEVGRSQVATSDSDAFKLLTRAREVARRAGVYHPAVKVVICETHLLCGAGEFEAAARAARRGIADAERHGLARTVGAFLAINLAEPLWHLGSWDEAVAAAGRALDLAPPLRTRIGLWVESGAIALARGDVAEAARRAGACRAVLATHGYEDQHHLPFTSLDIDTTLVARGPAAAVAVALEALRQYEMTLSSPRYVWPVLVSAAAAAIQAPGEDATALLDRLRALAEKLDVTGPVQQAWQLSYAALDPGVVLGPDSTGTPGESGEAAASGARESGADLESDADDGRLAIADAAVAAWQAVGQPYQEALALTHAARIALAQRANRAATTRLRRAAPIAEQLGAVPLAARIADLTRRAGSEVDADNPGLTVRELEVLRLVAAGQSNREIAATLVISPKTASVHVSNILAKLHAATRTEAAVKAHELGLLGLLSR
ncbi:MAG: LuxR C-terminal-related transcriptional regulator, partial [Trebonia sp.]